jgi:RTX calcium-binding nonapeptide repeat (4 copies)
MRIPAPLRLVMLGLLALIAFSVVSAFAAGINVPASNVGWQSVPVTAEDIKPAACAALYLTNIVRGSGSLTGTAGNDLIIGSAGADTIDGFGGDDCILAGNGDDLITGSDGIDICVGGPGTDIFTTCETENQ